MDPINAIASRVGDYWTREFQVILLATLEGVFASSNMESKIHDISGADGGGSLISGKSFIDAMQKMGDAKKNLTGIMIHSEVEAHLAKRELIEYVQEAGQSDRIPVFLNKRVIVDDAMPFDYKTNIGTAYIFGRGAIALGNGSHKRIVNSEIQRDQMSLSGEEHLISRHVFILHPRAIKWTGRKVAEEFPSDEELKLGVNWERVYEPKAIKIVKFVFKIDPASDGSASSAKKLTK